MILVIKMKIEMMVSMTMKMKMVVKMMLISIMMIKNSEDGQKDKGDGEDGDSDQENDGDCGEEDERDYDDDDDPEDDDEDGNDEDNDLSHQMNGGIVYNTPVLASFRPHFQVDQHRTLSLSESSFSVGMPYAGTRQDAEFESRLRIWNSVKTTCGRLPRRELKAMMHMFYNRCIEISGRVWLPAP